MPEKATLAVMKNGNADPGSVVVVQFNPQTLSVSYSNRGPASSTTTRDAKDANASDSMSTGYSSSLTVELIFDTSETGQDVRTYTLKIVKMLQADNASPRIRFLWGQFLYYGRIESLNETLDYWSDHGVPLRATVGLTMSSEKLDTVDTSAGFGLGVSVGVSGSANVSASVGVSAGVGTQPLTFAQAGESLQSLSARTGADWKAVASANNIDNPRQLQAGTVLNLNTGQ